MRRRSVYGKTIEKHLLEKGPAHCWVLEEERACRPGVQTSAQENKRDVIS